MRPNHALQQTRPHLRFLLNPKGYSWGLAAEGKALPILTWGVTTT